MKDRSALIDSNDTVAIALEPLKKGDVERNVLLTEDIPSGHKFALKIFSVGDSVIKYGFPIGSVSKPISAGEHVHSNNLRTGLKEGQSFEYKKQEDTGVVSIPADIPETIMAFKRDNGEIGIRNELWIIPGVGCVNGIVTTLAQWANATFKNIETHAWTHPFGCSQIGEDHETTQKILSDLVHHPNAGGVLVVSLGCENNTPESFKKAIGDIDNKRVKFLVCQDETDEIEIGKTLLRSIRVEMEHDKRVPCPISSLKIGLKCGGSDGFSGITANMLVGKFVDVFCNKGGAAVLTEVPEMFGAEQILFERCENEEIFYAAVTMIDEFKKYFSSHNQPIYENPSPGNKEGGITTLEEKSLGCVQKGGHALIRDVITYGDRIKKTGLTLLSGPGNDIVSTTAMCAAGVHLILFTTGRGTPLGSLVPTLKISTNSTLFQKKEKWIDYDAGKILEMDIQTILQELISLVVKTSEGDQFAKNEINNNRELSILKEGVTL